MNQFKIVIILFTFIGTLKSISQIHPEHKRANVWYFGMNAGLDFNNNQITVLTDNYELFDGLLSVSTISDRNGNYLFSASRTGVYSRNHQLLPHSVSCCANYVANGILLVPHPANDSIVYLFLAPYTEIEMDSCRFYRINLQLNNGQGDIDSIGPVFLSDGAGTIIALYHENLTDIWIVSIGYNNRTLRSWLLTANGFQITPSCTYTLQYSLKYLVNLPTMVGILGTDLVGSPLNNYVLVFEGEQYDGEYSQILLLKFDNRTGCFTDERTLLRDTTFDNDTEDQYLSASFSPSGKSIYITTMATSFNMPRWGYLLRIRNYEVTNFILDTIYYFPYAQSWVQSTPLGTMLSTGISNLPPYNAHPYYITEILNPDSDIVQVFPYSIYLEGKKGGRAFINTIEHWFYRGNNNTIKEDNIKNFLIYPNPATNVIYFKSYTANIPFLLNIRNTLGDVLYSNVINNNYLDISFLKEGIYFIEIFRDGHKHMYKLVKL